MPPRLRAWLALPCLALLGFAVGCSTFNPAPETYQPQLERALTQTNGPVIASVAILGRKEAAQMFDLPLHKERIQAAWVRVRNLGTNSYYFMPASLDPDYYAPGEVAYIFREFMHSKRNRKVAEMMEGRNIPMQVPPGQTVEGFVFTPLNQGAKHLRVDLLGELEYIQFEFFVQPPTGKYDFQRVEFEKIYPPEQVHDYSLKELPAVLKSLPATTTDARGKGAGDPLNLVVVGKQGSFALAFGRQGWNVTEVLTFGNVFKLISSFVFGRTWETSPVSSLYVFDRPQDFALQKARGTIHERNHLRLWLAPFTCEGDLVFVGQISRDIGLRFTFKAPGWMTHKIDPDVDEARNYLTQEMLTTESVRRVGWVEGAGKSTRAKPQRNLTGDPYYTDGLRVVLFLSKEPTSPAEVRFDDWRTDKKSGKE